MVDALTVIPVPPASKHEPDAKVHEITHDKDWAYGLLVPAYALFKVSISMLELINRWQSYVACMHAA